MEGSGEFYNSTKVPTKEKAQPPLSIAIEGC